MATIDDLLNALKEGIQANIKKELANTKDAWQRLPSKDFPELGLEGSELEDFLKEWVNNNDYSKAL